LRVEQLERGVFPDVEGLNPHFRPGAFKLRYLLDTNLDSALSPRVCQPSLDLFAPFFTRRTTHTCGCACTSNDHDRGYWREPTGSLLSLFDRVDIAHYLEHLVLDIQYDLGGADGISGITVARGSSVSQFVTVVESDEVELGVFALNTGLAMMHQALYTGAIDPRYHHVLGLARWLRQTGRAVLTTREAAAILRIDPVLARYCLSALQVLDFPVDVSDTGESPASGVGPVLVVDDDEDGRIVLGRALTNLGYSVRCVADGQTAVDILTRYDTSVVVLDAFLRDLDGLSIARWLIESQPATKLVLIAGGVDEAPATESPGDAVRLLPAPFKIARLHLTPQMISAN
jgi:CheY-like chemotaxis protein